MGRGKNKPKEIQPPETPGALLDTAYKLVAMYRDENERLKEKIKQLEKLIDKQKNL